eukprot:764921-Hanusia_phi.AAC.1
MEDFTTGRAPRGQDRGVRQGNAREEARPSGKEKNRVRVSGGSDRDIRIHSERVQTRKASTACVEYRRIRS